MHWERRVGSRGLSINSINILWIIIIVITKLGLSTPLPGLSYTPFISDYLVGIGPELQLHTNVRSRQWSPQGRIHAQFIYSGLTPLVCRVSYIFVLVLYYWWKNTWTKYWCFKFYHVTDVKGLITREWCLHFQSTTNKYPTKIKSHFVMYNAIYSYILQQLAKAVVPHDYYTIEMLKNNFIK